MTMQNPSASIEFDKVAQDSERSGVPDWRWKHGDMPCGMPPLLPVIERMLPDLSSGSRVLDLGCGNGFLAGRFAARGHSTVGIDCSESGIIHARSTHPNVRFEAEMIAPNLLEVLDEPHFDLVVSTEVVEHLYSPREWANTAYSCLRPGGWFVITTPYHGYLKNLAISVAGAWDRHHNVRHEGGHIKFFSRTTLTELLEQASFTNFAWRGAGRVPYLWKSIVMRCQRAQ